jgi:hypothetical protein
LYDDAICDDRPQQPTISFAWRREMQSQPWDDALPGDHQHDAFACKSDL